MTTTTPAPELDDDGVEFDRGRPPDPWKTTKKGREYVPAEGRHGIVYRVGDETIAEALERDRRNNPPEERSRAQRRADAANAKKRLPKPPPPVKVDLRELEPLLAEALRAPAMPCALLGDEWGANHFTIQGPALARQAVVAAEHNPWLAAKLEGMVSGDELALRLMSISTLTVATAGYAIPPLIWWLNLAVPDKAREMFNIPPRRRPKRPQPPEMRADANGSPSTTPAVS